SDDFVWDDLTDGEDEVVAAVAEEFVDLRGPCVVEFAFTDLVDEAAGDFAQGDDVVAPVVDAEESARRGAEHGRYLLICHGFVGAEGGKDVREAIAVVLPGEFGESAALGVH